MRGMLGEIKVWGMEGIGKMGSRGWIGGLKSEVLGGLMGVVGVRRRMSGGRERMRS